MKNYLAVCLLFMLNTTAFAQWERFEKIPKETLNIVVVNEEREPVKDVTITLRGLRPVDSPGSHYGVPPFYETFISNHEGEATVNYPKYVREEVATLYLTLYLTHPEYAETGVDKIELDGTSNPLVIKKGATINASVTMETKSVKNFTAHIGFATHTVSDSQSVKGIIPGNHNMYISHIDENGSIYYSEVVSIEAGSNQTIDMAFELYKGLTLNGRIDETVPRPIQSGKVEVNLINEPRFNQKQPGKNGLAVHRSFHANINEDGTFSMKNLPNGFGEVIAICDAFVSKKIEGNRSYNQNQNFMLHGDEQELLVEMEPSASVTGVVTDKEGNPIEGATVSTWPNVFWGNGLSTVFLYPFSNYSDTTDKNGRYSIKQIPTGSRISFAVSHEKYHLPTSTDDMGRQRRQSETELKPGELISQDFVVEKVGTTVIKAQ